MFVRFQHVYTNFAFGVSTQRCLHQVLQFPQTRYREIRQIVALFSDFPC